MAESTDAHVIEASQDQRDCGQVFLTRKWQAREAAADIKLPVYPVCIRGMANLRKEIGDPQDTMGNDLSQWHKQHPLHLYAVTVLGEKRNCPGWRQYIPGIRPQQLWEAVMFEELERRLEENRRKWEGQMEEERREWQSKRDAESRRESRRFNLAAIFLSVLAVCIAVASYKAQVAALLQPSPSALPMATPIRP